MNNKNLNTSLLAILVIFILGIGVFQYVSAEDDEREDEYEQEDSKDDDDEDEKNDDQKEEETITQTVKLPDKIITKTIIENITKKDSDRDGLLDENDPHPNIAEMYVVNDNNNNGIDDKYDLKY